MPSSAEPAAQAGVAAGPQELSERSVQFNGNAMAARVLRWLGWELQFDGLPSKQGVLVIYPHTSNWDFLYGILTKMAIGMPVVLWGKDSLFRIPLFGRWLRSQGGVPVDRSARHGLVEQMIESMHKAKAQGQHCWLALTPEGTRSFRPGLRTGFYRVAVACQVPVGMAFIDFGTKRVGIMSYWQFCGVPEADMALMRSCYAGVLGRWPEQAAPLRLIEK